MTPSRPIQLILCLLLLLVVVYIARNTYWAEVTLPMPPKGEALTNPFYAQMQLARALGAKPEWSRGLVLPPSDGILVMHVWNWELTPDRRSSVEHWVSAGGRLVVDQSLIDPGDALGKWSGIERQARALRPVPGVVLAGSSRCYTLDEQRTLSDRYSICGMDANSALTSARVADWSLSSSDAGNQALRVRMGRGSVTAINGTPFADRGLFDDDNARLFVVATQLRAGDEIHFFTEGHYPSLLELAWRLGWPVLYLLGALTVLGLWRNGIRFGPSAAPTERARRSLAEQIRGTGRFTVRTGGGEALHGAAARALHEAARAHITAYDHLAATQRMSALAQAVGVETRTLAAALDTSGPLRPDHLRHTLELLESARRLILLNSVRTQNGNRI